MLPLLFTFAAIFGLIVGSFLNVCIHRMPMGKRLGGRSVCPFCHEIVRWYDNIPLLSFLILHGRCRHCKRPIHWQYPVVESVTAVLSMAILYRSGLDATAYFIWFLLFVCPLIVLSAIDLHHRLIPDVLTLPGIIIGIASTVLFMWPDLTRALLTSLYGILSGGVTLLVLGQIYMWIRKREGMGGGDVKLAAMLGAFLGWKGMIFVFFVSSLLAILYAITVMVTHRDRKGPVIIPYGPFLALAGIIFHQYGTEILSAYFSIVLV